MTNPKSATNFVAYARKAFAAAAMAVVGVAVYLTTVVSGSETLSDVSVAEWIGAVVYVGATFGVTFSTPPNAPKRSI